MLFFFIFMSWFSPILIFMSMCVNFIIQCSINIMHIKLSNLHCSFILLEKYFMINTLNSKCFSLLNNTHVGNTSSLLDLPELALDSILERLSPDELCSMVCVSSYLRDKCTSNDFWEKHMKLKWGGLIGNVACREWHWYMSFKTKCSLKNGKNGKSSGFDFCICSLVNTELDCKSEFNDHLPSDSIMAWYLSLENGQFWFPGQVYNRENGHDCFMLSCYDAELSHDMKTNTFRARYRSPLHHKIEENISWNRLRAPPIDISPYNLHYSYCVKHLKPGDHVEIQWRKNNQCPYGWWYGVVGHLEFCRGDENHCICGHSDKVMLEFNQYSRESRWRILKVDRKTHHEVGNEVSGFYGGIRKLDSKEEISKWMNLWPTKVLD